MTSASSHGTQGSSVTRTPQPPRPHAPGTEPETIRYGTDEHGHPAIFALTWPTPHMLITGGTGTGLSTASRIVLLEGARQGIDVRFCSPKAAAAAGLRGLPGISIATEPQDMIRMAEEAKEEMQRRYQAIEEGAADPGGYQRILLALDDCEFLACTMADRGKPVMTAFDMIAILGGGARISVLRTAHVLTSIPPGTIPSFGTRVSLGRPGRHQAQALFGGPAAGRDVPPGLPGAGIASADGRAPVRIQVHWPGLTPVLPLPWAGRRIPGRRTRRGRLAGPRGDDRPRYRMRRPGRGTLTVRWLGPPRRPSRSGQAILVMAPAADQATGFLYLVRMALRGQRAHLAATAGDGAPAGRHVISVYGWKTGTGEGPEPSGPCIGAVQGDRVYLFPLAAYEAARSIAADLGVPFTLTFAQLHPEMRDSGLLQCEDTAAGRRYTVLRHPAGGRFRVWDLPADAIFGTSAPSHLDRPGTLVRTPHQPGTPPADGAPKAVPCTLDESGRRAMSDEDVITALVGLWSGGDWRRLEARRVQPDGIGGYCVPVVPCPARMSAGRGAAVSTTDAVRNPATYLDGISELADLLSMSGWRRLEIVGHPVYRPQHPGGWCERADGSGVSVRAVLQHIATSAAAPGFPHRSGPPESAS